MRRHDIDEPPGERLGGADGLAGQQQPAGAALSDQFRQQRRLDDRGDADPDLRHAEEGAVAGDAQIAGGGELEPGAERIAVDPGDDRDRQAPKGVAAAMHGGDEPARAVPIERRDLADVGAADKGALTGAAQNNEPQLRVRGEARRRLR